MHGKNAAIAHIDLLKKSTEEKRILQIYYSPISLGS
jgi:hypothetical protein